MFEDFKYFLIGENYREDPNGYEYGPDTCYKVI